MKLDERILPGKRPLSCFDTEVAKVFLGKKGYFNNTLSRFCYLKNCKQGCLRNIFVQNEKCFVAISDYPDTDYKYFLPDAWLKPEEPEKKWRPFTLDDFVKRFDSEVGTRVFLIRSKTTPVNQRRLLLTGIIQDKDPCVCGVYLGGCYFTFSELFQKFDVRFGKEDWQPFGVYE